MDKYFHSFMDVIDTALDGFMFVMAVLFIVVLSPLILLLYLFGLVAKVIERRFL